MDIKQLRRELKKWLFSSIAGKTVFNESLGNYIILNKSGLKHAISFSNLNYVQKLKSLYKIEDIVGSSIFIRTETDRRQRKHIKEIIILQNEVEIENTKYDVKIIVRHTNEGRFYYDHALFDIN